MQSNRADLAKLVTNYYDIFVTINYGSVQNFSDAFVKARYFFAQEENGISNLFDDFVRIVCEYAVEVYERKLKEGLEADVAFGGN